TLRLLDAHPGHARARIIADRGPFALEAERALFAAGDFDVLISKNSGSAATQPKLQVARERGLPVLILRRPPLPCVVCDFASAAELLVALAAETP
uniref:precorrin-6A/cobalt-precorrin-6A reductase n=1 Tax=Pseudomonas sp. UBA6323 TaxID=1947329 RepID=UPI0025E938AD